MNTGSVACRGNILFWTLSIQISSAAYPFTYSVYTGTIPQGQSDSGLNLRTRLHLIPKLRIYGAIPLLTHVHSWHEKWQIRLHLTCMCCMTTIWERYQRSKLYPSVFGIFCPHISLFLLVAEQVQGHQAHAISEAEEQRHKTQCHMISKIHFFRTLHFYTLGDGHKSNWYFRRHAFPPSSGTSGEVSNHLVGPTTWRTSFALGTICNKGPKRNCALLQILPGGAARECLKRQTN